MNHEALADELNQLLATESRSVASAVASLTPHLTPATFRAFEALRRIADTSREHARVLSDLIDRLELPLRVVTFPIGIGDLNYLTIDKLLPHVIAEKQRQIAAYERAVDAASDRPDVAGTLRTLLDENRKQLDTLNEQLRVVTAV